MAAEEHTAVGILGTVVAALSAGAAWVGRYLFKRISRLEKDLAECNAKHSSQQHELGRLEAKHQALQEQFDRGRFSPPTARIVVRTDGIIQNVTANVLELYGYNPSELIGEHHHVLVPPEFRGQHDAAFAARAEDDTVKGDAVAIRNAYVNHKAGGTVSVRVGLKEERSAEYGKVFVADLTRTDPL